MIPMEDMENRRVYRVRSRNLVVGIWVAERRGLIGIRRKFDSTYPFLEFHHDADRHVGTVRPDHALNAWAPADMDLDEYRNHEGLMEFLQPFQDDAMAKIMADREREEQERQSKQWAPQTFVEYLTEANRYSVRSWWREELGGSWQDNVLLLQVKFKEAREAAKRGEVYDPRAGT